MLSADQVETIIDTALKVLATQGMRFLEPSSRATGEEIMAAVNYLNEEWAEPPNEEEEST